MSEGEIKESKDKKGKSKDKVRGNSKAKVFFIFLIIVVLLLGTFFALIRFDIFGIGTKLSGSLGNVPIVKNILPSQESDTFANLSKEELISLNQSLEETNVSYSELIETLNDKIDELNNELTTLRQLEDEQIQFKADKAEFDRLVALNDTSAYASFYESIAPENAEALYVEAITQNEMSKEFKTYASTFENMKKDAAATVLEELMSSDIDLVVQILGYLTSEKRADILSSMSSKNAAICVKMMTP